MLIKQSAPSSAEKTEAFSTSTPLPHCGFIPVQLFSGRGWAKLGDLGKPSIPETKKLPPERNSVNGSSRDYRETGLQKTVRFSALRAVSTEPGGQGMGVSYEVPSASSLELRMGVETERWSVCLRETDRQTDRQRGKVGRRAHGGRVSVAALMKHRWSSSNPPRIPASLPPPSPAPSLPFFPPRTVLFNK